MKLYKSLMIHIPNLDIRRWCDVRQTDQQQTQSMKEKQRRYETNHSEHARYHIHTAFVHMRMVRFIAILVRLARTLEFMRLLLVYHPELLSDFARLCLAPLTAFPVLARAICFHEQHNREEMAKIRTNIDGIARQVHPRAPAYPSTNPIRDRDAHRARHRPSQTLSAR